MPAPTTPTYTLRSERAQAPRTEPPLCTWDAPDGSTWLEVRRATDGFELRFPGMADFHVAGDGLRADCWPAPDLSPATREHLFLNQVLPLMHSQQGMLVLHGAAVEIDGAAAAFLGPSTRGKSTLAASFASSGHAFLSDDGLIVRPVDDGFAALPSHASIRLWQDSEEAVLPEAVARAPSADYSPKARLIAGDAIPHRDTPARLTAIYLLGSGRSPSVSIEPVARARAVALLLENTFLLDIEEPASIGVHFAGLTACAEAVPCFHLDYPRSYEDLPQVRAAVLEHVRSLVD